MNSQREYNKLLATTLVQAAEIREQSFVSNPKFETGESMVPGTYGMTIQQAADVACARNCFPDSTSTLVSILLRASWNDALYWARQVLDDELV